VRVKGCRTNSQERRGRVLSSRSIGRRRGTREPGGDQGLADAVDDSTRVPICPCGWRCQPAAVQSAAQAGSSCAEVHPRCRRITHRRTDGTLVEFVDGIGQPWLTARFTAFRASGRLIVLTSIARASVRFVRHP